MTSKLNVFHHATKEYKEYRGYKRGKWVNDGLVAMPLHVRYKLESCSHQWVRNATYESGQSCITCSCSRGTYNNYRDYLRKQLVYTLRGFRE